MVNNCLEILFPNSCVLCGLRSFQNIPLCEPCQSGLVHNRASCSLCASPLALHSAAEQGGVRCAQCLIAAPPWDQVIAPWLYDEQMAFLIQRWKFHGERRLSPLLARLWREGCTKTLEVDAMVPVPLHWRRLCSRGFNQSHLLCQHLRRQCPELSKLPLLDRTVRRIRATEAQAGLSADSRSGNLAGAFEVIRPCGGMHLAIVDDVMTTGSTARAMTNTLLAAGARAVDVWCLARTPAPTI